MIARLRAALGRIAIDVEPLRVSRPFRRLWVGLAISEFGYQFTIVATFVQVYELTGSAASVGLIGLVGLVGLVAGTLLGSTFLDRYDRRTLLLIAQVGFMACAATLLAGSLLGEPPVAIVYAPVALIALLSAVDMPTRSAMTPRLVGEDQLAAAITLNQVVWNATALAGPAAAGVVIARLGLPWAYAIDLASYLAMVWAAARLPSLLPDGGEARSSGWAAVREGFAFLRGRPVLQANFGADVVAMVFGMPRALFPILAATQFGRGPEVVGLLFAAPSVGALVGALTAGWVGSVRRQGAAVLWAVALWGAGIAAFGLVGDNLVAALVLLAFAGAADVVSAVFRGTMLQVSTPDALRGRLWAIHALVVTGGPRLGDLEAGLVAQAFSPAVSVVSGGVLCILGTAALAVAAPAFRRYDARAGTA